MCWFFLLWFFSNNPRGCKQDLVVQRSAEIFFFFYKKVLFGEIEATDEEAPEDWESNDMDEAECCVEAVLDLLDVEVIDVE